MKTQFFFSWLLVCACLQTSAPIVRAAERAGRAYDFPIYTNKPIGKQLTGGHAPANTVPLAPEEARGKIHVPPGFEVRLFAAEPEVVNPVAMTWDERGRLWVLELYEYPKGAPKGEKGRDRIKILEDTDGDGKADKVTVFADGFSLATGLALGRGGVYVGQAPDFLFLEDTNGDDRVDRRTVLKTGFGMEDRHELLNGFAWGPDGWLYMTHGVFTYSQVRDPNDPDDDGVKMDAALGRFHPVTRKFEVFADGTSNPWGVDWDERGEAFVSACVIMHLFHMAPGGQYNRQGGTWPNPYSYVRDLPSKGLPAIVDWRHFRAAHAGLTVYQGNQYPSEWRGLVFLGNIHQNAVNCDRLTAVGSTYQAERESRLLGASRGDQEVGAGNFLVSQDPWLRPVSIQTGPDGALWVMDWYDRYPCYQNAQADPDGVDREYGRIWRVVWTGDKPGRPVPSRPEPQMDLKKLSSGELVQLLSHPNSWHRRQAERLLAERNVTPDAAVVKALQELALPAKSAGANVNSLAARLAALSVLHQAKALSAQLLDVAAADSAPEVRIWAARFDGEQMALHPGTPPALGLAARLGRLTKLAQDSDVRVRASTAVALRQLVAGSLTVDSPGSPEAASAELSPVFSQLLMRPGLVEDTFYPHIVWQAMEPRAAQAPESFFPLLSNAENPLGAYCVRRIMRRISDLSDAGARERHLNAAMLFLGGLASKTSLADAALDGLIEAQKSKGAPPTIDMQPILAKLTSNAAVEGKARRFASLLGDASATRGLLAKINDPQASAPDRLRGVQAAREAKDDAARGELLKLLATEKQNQELLLEGVRAVNSVGGYEVAYNIVDAWKSFSPATRRAAAEELVTRTKTARALLAGVDKKLVEPSDISATARRALARSEDETIASHADRVLGRYRESGQDKLKLIADKRKVVLADEPDVKAGREVAQKTCFVCHKLHGEGADVGPDLTGVGRSSLDALLANVIDPNQIIGNGYEATEIELKDGTTLTGRVVEDTATRIKLLATGPIEHTIAKSDIASENGKPKVRKLELSLMPEGLEQLPDADFRNMIWYLLNPPQDNRPWTPALRKELLGEPMAGKSAKAP